MDPWSDGTKGGWKRISVSQSARSSLGLECGTGLLDGRMDESGKACCPPTGSRGEHVTLFFTVELLLSGVCFS